MMKQNGFTLIELLIVVAIIGILAAIAVPNFLNAQTRAKIAQVESGVRALATAFELYRVDYGAYALHDPNHNYNVWLNGLTTPVSYIAKIPTDIFQTGVTAGTQSMSNVVKQMELHPEPFYTSSGAAAWGSPTLDKIPQKGSSDDLTLRFRDDPEQRQKALGMWPNGRYIVSVGPDQKHTYPGVYNVSNGLVSYGDIVRVIP